MFRQDITTVRRVWYFLALQAVREVWGSRKPYIELRQSTIRSNVIYMAFREDD
jgi:hypothetical protein